MYTACYMPSSPAEIEDKSGFRTKEKAWNWIKKKWLCNNCFNMLENGGDYWVGPDENGDEVSEWHEVTHVGLTPCGSEWMVILTSDLDNCETFDDVMNAAGCEVVYRRDNA